MSEFNLVLAIQKGRVLDSYLNLIKGTKFDIKEDPKETRKILIETQSTKMKVLVVRGWDIPTYVSLGIADLGVVGKDILLEKTNEHFIELEDLSICNCRLSLAGKRSDLMKSHKLSVATKYPKTARKFLEENGIQPDVIYLHGAQEIAPELGLSDAIVDLVDSGNTLKENGLEEIKKIRDISTRLIANVACLKTKEILIDDYKSIIS
ncbi:MAG: ATP phosphoribosyltransferase [Gammaproteobacteria bacterium]|nr:ATP phosphoribosyltransferase [Gammaproteobacteria bacterium]|tara:strand:- start:8747 stop:9367 length:621 start_codon:yes stop_codon:yes gene_type:complete